MRLAENESLKKLGTGALRHAKIQYFIQQLVYENEVEAQLRRKRYLKQKMQLANEATQRQNKKSFMAKKEHTKSKVQREYRFFI